MVSPNLKGFDRLQPSERHAKVVEIIDKIENGDATPEEAEDGGVLMLMSPRTEAEARAELIHRRSALANLIERMDEPFCHDCKADPPLYMVKDAVWAESGLGPYDGWLCFSCLESRLDRKLVLADFNHARCNYLFSEVADHLGLDELPCRIVRDEIECLW